MKKKWNPIFILEHHASLILISSTKRVLVLDLHSIHPEWFSCRLNNIVPAQLTTESISSRHRITIVKIKPRHSLQNN